MVAIIDDRLDEAEETFTVSLGALPPGVTAGTTSSVALTITDNDTPTVRFTEGAQSVAEGAGTVSMELQMSTAPQASLSIPLSSADITATSGSDYVLTTTEVTFTPSGSLTQTVMAMITDDSLDEANETFTVSLGSLPSGVTAGTTSSVTLTITDNDSPTVRFAEQTRSVSESAGIVSLILQLDTAPRTSLSIPLSSGNITATAGSDYTLTTTEVTFTPGGELTQMVTVMISEDSLDEADETFTVSLGTLPTGGVVTAGTPNSVTVTITDNDVPEVTFSSATATVAEGAGTVSLTVRLNSSPANSLSIPVRTTDVTATAGSDYTELSSETVDFAAGTSTLTQTVMVTITDDSIDESEEMFMVSFGTLPIGVVAGSTISTTVTITDDDVPNVTFPPHDDGNRRHRHRVIDSPIE